MIVSKLIEFKKIEKHVGEIVRLTFEKAIIEGIQKKNRQLNEYIGED